MYLNSQNKSFYHQTSKPPSCKCVCFKFISDFRWKVEKVYVRGKSAIEIPKWKLLCIHFTLTLHTQLPWASVLKCKKDVRRRNFKIIISHSLKIINFVVAISQEIMAHFVVREYFSNDHGMMIIGRCENDNFNDHKRWSDFSNKLFLVQNIFM